MTFIIKLKNLRAKSEEQNRLDLIGKMLKKSVKDPVLSSPERQKQFREDFAKAMAHKLGYDQYIPKAGYNPRVA